jgi:hypothetical protein
MICFGSSNHEKKNQLEQKNKMADKIKMAVKHEFSNQLKLGIWKESLKKNCGEAFFLNYKMED